jgi:TPR repeat protein
MSTEDNAAKAMMRLFDLATERGDSELFLAAAERALELHPIDYITATISFYHAGLEELKKTAPADSQNANTSAKELFWRGAKLADPLCLYKLGEIEDDKPRAHAYFNLANSFDHIGGVAGIQPVRRLEELESRMDAETISHAEELAIEKWHKIDKRCRESPLRYSEDDVIRILSSDTNGERNDIIYRVGLYTNENLAWFPRCSHRAYELLQIGDKKGYIGCKAALGIYFTTGFGVIPVDYEKAAPLLEDSANAGFPNAKVKLAYLYAEGKGKEINRVKAYQLVESALHSEWNCELNVNRRLVPEVDFEASGLKRKLENNMASEELKAAIERLLPTTDDK